MSTVDVIKVNAPTRKHNTPRGAALPGATDNRTHGGVHWHAHKSLPPEEETRSDSSGIRTRNPKDVKRMRDQLYQKRCTPTLYKKRNLKRKSCTRATLPRADTLRGGSTVVLEHLMRRGALSTQRRKGKATRKKQRKLIRDTLLSTSTCVGTL